MNTELMFSSATDMHETPIEFFNKINSEFNFTLDVCATKTNAKCKSFYTEEDDGLVMPWRGVVWCNPPYGRDIVKWIEKGFLSAMEGATVVLLIPSRTDTRWFHDFCTKGEIRFIKGRLKFGGAKNNAPFPSMIVIFRKE